MQAITEKIWCVVPAAGIGSRMQAETPKQYLKLNKLTILDTTLERLLSTDKLELIVVSLTPDDSEWHKSIFSNHRKVITVQGGRERVDSVLNGISALKQRASINDWVLVHDAVRPCVRVSDIELLIKKALESQIGAILVAPLHDTIKESDDGFSAKTLDRSALWRALTPQVFKINQLELALTKAKEYALNVTDEASAVEQLGQPVQLVKSHTDNIKITSPEDLDLARYYIAQQDK